MFFGSVITPGGECSPDSSEGEILHVSQACLYNPTSNEKTYLQVCQGDKCYALCALQKDKQESVSLDIFVTTRGDVRFKTSGGKNEVHLVGYFEPEDDSDLEDLSDESYDEDDDDQDDDASQDSKSKEDEDEAMKDSDLDSDDDDDDDEEKEDDDESDSDDDLNEKDDSEDEDDEEDEDDDEDEEEEEEKKVFSSKKKPAAKQPKKMMEKPQEKAKMTSTVASKKRKNDVVANPKPSKNPKFDGSAKAPEAEFEKQIVDYLKKNGRCMISQLAGKVRKPESLKNVKYQNFLKSKPSFAIEGQFVSLKA